MCYCQLITWFKVIVIIWSAFSLFVLHSNSLTVTIHQKTANIFIKMTLAELQQPQWTKCNILHLTFIGPCLIVIAEEWKTNLMSLAILLYFLCTQHVSDINISIIRSLRLCCWITTLVVLFLFRCVLEIWCGWVWVVSVLVVSVLQASAKQEQNDQCGNSTA